MSPLPLEQHVHTYHEIMDGGSCNNAIMILRPRREDTKETLEACKKANSKDCDLSDLISDLTHRLNDIDNCIELCEARLTIIRKEDSDAQ